MIQPVKPFIIYAFEEIFSLYLIKLPQLSILILDGRPGSVIQRHGYKQRGHVQLQQLRLLWAPEVGVDGEQVEVLGQVAPVLRDLDPEQRKDGEQEVV